MNLVCIESYYAPNSCKYTAGKTYQVIKEDETTIQIIDDNGNQIAIHKGHVFYKDFKYQQEIRNDKLESLGIN